MIAYRITTGEGIDAIETAKVGEPSPGPGEVLVELRAASLNYRDLMVAKGGYPRNDTRPVIPLSDGAGVVASVGPGVTRWSIGDRVAPNFMRDWISGPITEHAVRSGLGGGVDGVLAERFVMPERSLVAIPDELSFEEAATLPCAALTAWNALRAAGTTAGDTVLTLGTGGVSMFAVQVARALGAVPVITSSSDAKLERARAAGAAHTVNYATTPEWQDEVRAITGGRGVDHVLETGGPGTLERSLASVRVGGTVSLIGVLADGHPPSLVPALLNAVTVRGIYVGSVELFEEMNRAIAANGIKPVIHETVPFDRAIDAYRALESQRHVGKIVIIRGG
ncbi:MAG: NAD(P)-dependent alcohol dehydrogenase [Planctomycetota bacterium]